MSKTLKLVIEKDDGDEIAGSVDTANFLFSTVGSTEIEIVADLRNQIANFLEHEGKNIPEWKDVTADQIEFDIEYDLTALFELISAIKINSIAELAGINKALLRQYASGVKTASAQQSKKVQTAVRLLGEQLMRIKVA